ncbi:MAG: carbon-nitrogen hydrolase family protein [Mesorhizobium sp.]|nr:MAG: carbon-nitrogen hydrolase family protein [Mesorhizobium sp.]
MTRSAIRVACLQLNPGNDLEANLGLIAELTDRAVDDGAALVALPEFGTFLDRRSAIMRGAAFPEAGHPALERLREEARRRAIWLLIGSIVVGDGQDAEAKLVNRSYLVGPDGSVHGSYDKIHLFDAQMADGRIVGESRHYRGGTEAVLVRAPFGGVGMTICYDLRFPDLYRRLAQAGAEILTVPSAFTAETGKAHWDPLLRARAIETGCFVLAPATFGEHPGGWVTHGQASIVDPWGTVVARCEDAKPGFAAATIDLDEVKRARSKIPSLSTQPSYELVDRSTAL